MDSGTLSLLIEATSLADALAILLLSCLLSLVPPFPRFLFPPKKTPRKFCLFFQF
jgi:hypothetical protein